MAEGKARKQLTLGEYIARESRGRSFYEVLMETYKAVHEGKLKLRDPSPPRSFYEYMFRPDYTVWFWTVLGLVGLTVISILLTDLVPSIVYLRYVLGSIYVLFLPGYVTIEALYPYHKELSPLERLALSIGLSLALVPLMGLVLNYTAWGIRLTPILGTTSIYIVVIAILAAYRKYNIIRKH